MDAPTKLCPEILTQLHESHQGSVRTKQRARLSVYWPGIDNDIDNVILSCQQCQDHLPSNPKEPLTQKPKPDRPFQEIALDLCSHAGHAYLIIVDLLHRLASRYLPGSWHHNYTSHNSCPPIILSHCYTRRGMVRWWTTVYV